MARPKGSVSAVEPVVEINKVREIKHVARTISIATNGVAESAVDVEQYLRMTYFEAGWTLFDVQVLSHNPNTATLMYILVR